MGTSAERIIQVISPSDSMLDLLVLGCSTDEANQYDQTIRNSGMAVHLKTAYNPDELETLLDGLNADLILVNTDAEELDFTTAITQIREVCPTASFILLSDDPAEELFFAAETRAQDIIQRNDHAHLIYVATREQQNTLARKKLIAVTQELDDVTQRCNTLAESSGEAIAYIHDGMHVYANPAYISLFGYSKPCDLASLPILDLIAKDDRLKFKSTLQALAKNQNAERLQINGQTQDGEAFPITMEFSPVTVEGEACTQIIITDQSPENDLQKRISELANFDTETGLYNRKYFIEKLEEEIQAPHEPGENLSLLLLNIVNYSGIKDEHGLKGCDILLRDAAKILSDTTYETDLVSRFGEHEFSILCTAGTDALALAERLLSNMNKHIFKISDQFLKPELFIGVTHSDKPPVKSSHEFINRAVKASNKARSENTPIAQYDHKSMAGEVSESTDEGMLQLIDNALQHDRFQLVYQPIVSLHGNSREDYSVYLRMLNEEDEPLLPEYFIEQAEKADRMAEIDRWVIRNAVREVSEQRRQGNKINFMITLSASGIEDDSLLLWICDSLREFKAKGSWLTFQLKERDVIGHLDLVEQLAEGLKKINCRIALDHFVCEQESVNLLKHINFDIAKYSPDVVSDISTNKDQAALLTSYSEQIRELGIKTIAAAVEEANQLAVLWNVGVDFIQGNFIQEPTETISYDFE